MSERWSGRVPTDPTCCRQTSRRPKANGIATGRPRWGILSARIVVVWAGLSAVAVGASAAQADSWRFASGTRTEGSTTIEFESYWRGAEAVSRELSGGELTSDTRCEGVIYRAVDYVTSNVVVRDGLSAEDCFNWATGSLIDGVARLHGAYVPDQARWPVDQSTDSSRHDRRPTSRSCCWTERRAFHIDL